MSFENGPILNACCVSDGYRKAGVETLSREERIILPETGNNDYKVSKRCAHLEACSILTDWSEKNINLDGLLPSTQAQILERCHRTDVVHMPDCLIATPPLRYYKKQLYNQFHPDYSKGVVDRESPLLRGAPVHWATLEVFTTRGDLAARIAEKKTKSPEFLLGVDMADELKPQMLSFIHRGASVNIHYNLKLPLRDLETLTTRMEVYKLAYQTYLTPQMERTYLNSDTDGTFNVLNDYTKVGEDVDITAEEVWHNLMVTMENSPRLKELTYHQPREYDDNWNTLDQGKVKSTWFRTPCNITLPGMLIEKEELFTLITDISIGQSIIVGRGYYIAMGDTADETSAVLQATSVQDMAHLSTVELKDGMPEWQARFRKVVYSDKTLAGRGRGGSLELADGMRIKSHMPQSQGESLLYRVLANQVGRESPVKELHRVIANSLKRVDDRYKKIALELEDYEVKNAMVMRLTAMSHCMRFALLMLTSFSESKIELTGGLIPMYFGDTQDTKILYGWIMMPQSHIRDDRSKVWITTIVPCGGDVYLGADNWSIYELKECSLRAKGVTHVAIKVTPISRRAMYNNYMLPRAWVNACGDVGQHLCTQELAGKANDWVDDHDNIMRSFYARFALYIVWFLEDGSSSQSASKECTKIKMSADSLRDGKKVYIINDEWWQKGYGKRTGSSQEMMMLTARDMANAMGEDVNDVTFDRWSWLPGWQYTAALTCGLPLMPTMRSDQLQGQIAVKDGDSVVIRSERASKVDYWGEKNNVDSDDDL